ncbi:MAG: hypothetical protein HZC47_01005 [Methanobacterium sp.]|uniref:hypothetical protein n=1 Tax=Methanobacterium sp. TaxID=2164 RepID=UPI003D64F741|nr:hypothetical protein [Methanobacterium sp.]
MVLKDWSRELLEELYGSDLELMEIVRRLPGCTYEEARVILEVEKCFRLGKLRENEY